MLIVTLVWCGTVIADRQKLNESLIRLHIVADSDEVKSQQLKIRVRDGIVESLRNSMAEFEDVEEARAYLREHLPDLESLANRILQEFGADLTAKVSLSRETFPKKSYDTFTLPAGVYEALRIVIGEGKGENWWCVVFPQFCLPTSSEEFQTAAVNAGFTDELTAALSDNEVAELRFLFLDALGWIENFFYRV